MEEQIQRIIEYIDTEINSLKKKIIQYKQENNQLSLLKAYCAVNEALKIKGFVLVSDIERMDNELTR